MTLRKPVAYQVLAGSRQPVDVKFLLSRDGAVRFAVGKYETGRTLVIDPVYVFSSYLGGSTGADEISAVTTDANGNILVTGTTGSTDFPTSNALQSSLGSDGESIFVSKFDPTGATLIYSTYLGGSSQASGAAAITGGAIAVDAAGDAIISGLASSSNVPQAGAIVSPSCQINNGCYFLASLKPDGSALNYAGLIGGEQGFYTFGLHGDLAVDASGNAYLAGTTDNSTFQITAGTLAASVVGYPYNETFVLKVDPTGKLIYSTVVPGNDTNSNDLLQPYTNDFIPSGMAVDAAGDVTIAGTSGRGLPVTSGVIGPQFPNAYVNVENPSAGFVLQLNPTASAVNFASYLPGTDYGQGLAVDAQGNFYLTGGTQETNLPVSSNAYEKAPVANSDGQIEGAYVLVLNAQATAVVGATYIGAGAVGGYGFSAIALDSHGHIFVGGSAEEQGFPLQDPFVTKYEFTDTIADMVLAEMSPDLSTLEFGSYLSSTNATSYPGSIFSGLTVDNSNNLIAAGTTYSRSFPTTPGSFEPQLPTPANPLVGYQHSFVTKFNMSTSAPAVCFSTFSVSFGNVNANSSESQTVTVTNCGDTSLDITSIASSDPTVTTSGNCGSVAAGAACPVTLTFTPVSSKATSGTVTLSDNAQTIPQTVSFTGQGVAPEIVANASPLSFGHVLVGAPAIDAWLYISNGGQAALSVGTVTVSGAGYSLVSNGCTQSLPGNSPYFSCPIEIAFAPVNSGTQTGSVVIVSNDPATSQLTVALTGVGDAIYAVPSISSISAPTVLINNGGVNLSISGANFYPQSVAQLNGVALSTSFQSNNSLQATIPASSLTAIGEQYLTVVNPLPGGGISPSVTVTPYQTLVIDPAALVSVPSTGMLYAAIPSSATSNPNTVIPINAATGALGTPIPVGNNPGFLAVSSDGSYLYVANTTDETVQRINLTTDAVEATFPYTPNIYCLTCATLDATDLETVPGSPQEVLLAQGSILSLFNDAGLVNYIPTSACCYADPGFTSIALAGNPLTIYGLPFSYGGGFFQTVNLTNSGLQYTRPTGYTGGPNDTTGAQVISDGTLLYTSAGQVWNPSTPAEVGAFPVQTDNATSYPNMRNINLDASLGEIYVIGDQTYNDSDAAVISAYGTKSLTLTGTLAFPQFYYPYMGSIVRWGANGVAFIAAGAGLTDQEVYILRSSVVGQQSSNPTPVLNSISPTSVTSGGPTFTLTLNGTGFLPSSAVEWNGTPLTTAYVSAQQLTASVPASDIADEGVAQVSVFNPAPGGGSSVAESFTATHPVTPSFKLSVSPTSVSVTQNSSGTSTITVSDVGGFTGTVTLGATGLPSGVTASFAAGTAAGTQVLTLSASSTAALGGPVTVTVTGTAGALNATTTVSLTVTGQPTFQASGAAGSNGAITVNPGATTGNTSTISLAGTNGYSGTVNLSCSISPTAANDPASCSLSPASVTLNGSTAQTSTLTVTTTAATRSENQMKRLFWPSTGGTALALVLLFGVPRRRRNWLAMVGLAVLVVSIGALGCGGGGGGGGGGGNTGTSAGTYTVTVTGTGTSSGSSNSVTATVGSVTLTVN